MKDNQLVTLSKSFAVDIIKLCDCIKAREKSNAVISQLLCSGTSIGANIHEANYAASRADFINKLQTALKECYESDYWLDIFKESGIIADDEYSRMFSQCSKLRKHCAGQAFQNQRFRLCAKILTPSLTVSEIGL